jgi:hypothetical protein
MSRFCKFGDRPSKLLDGRFLVLSSSKSISCRVCARGVAFSKGNLAGLMEVEIGGGDTGLSVEF